MNTSSNVPNIPIWKNKSLENLPNEIWKDIPNFKGHYKASNLGRIKSVKRIIKTSRNFKTVAEKIMSQPKVRSGYLNVTLSHKKGKTKSFRAHRLIAKTFIPNPKNLPVINHKNEIKYDNNINNLEWCTVSYNTTYNDSHRKNGRPVNQYSLDGKLIKSFRTIIEASESNKIFSASCIWSCVNNKQLIHRGFLWKYKTKK